MSVQAKIFWDNGRIGAIETRGDLLHATLYAGAEDLQSLGSVVLWRGTAGQLARLVEMLEIAAGQDAEDGE